jgi:electron transfer flavoprotein alpha subunit
LTTVGPARTTSVDRLQMMSPDAPLATQVKAAVEVLLDRGAFGHRDAPVMPLPETGGDGGVIAVLAEPGQDALTQELCGLAARLAARVGGSTAVLAPHDLDPGDAGSWGADQLVHIEGPQIEEDVARVLTAWADSAKPLAIFAGSTAFGREIASRAAAAIGAGLTGDAIDVELVGDRFVAWKPAFGGQLVAPITATSAVQMATVRAGVLPRSATRDRRAAESTITVEPRGRVRVVERRRDDHLENLAEAHAVIGIGTGVKPDEFEQLDELRALLDAELGCTRKVTDKGWMPHARQIGITGRAIAPQLFVSIGASGKFNHMVGVRAAGTVLAINPDTSAPVWSHSDIGIVGNWQDVVPLLVEQLREVLPAS